MKTHTKLVAGLFLAAFLLRTTSAEAAVPYVNGNYTTPTVQGTFQFTPLRAVVQFGYEGRFVINGRSYPGSFYAIRGTTKVGMVWYYGSTGIPAGSAVVAPAGGAYIGQIEFTNRKGAVTDSGTATVTITVK